MDDLLSQTLSARTYEPEPETSRYPPGSSSPEFLGEPPIMQAESTIDETQPDPPPASGNHEQKKRGRPRMSSTARPSSAHAKNSQSRRTQIREAQRTYRQKKETMLNDMKTRISKLEGAVGRMSGSLSDLCRNAVDSGLNVSHPGLFYQLTKALAEIDSVALQTSLSSSSTTAGSVPDDGTSFGYLVRAEENKTRVSDVDHTRTTRRKQQQQQQQLLPRNAVTRPLNGSSTITYCFQEPEFCRRLQRYCLEYTYRLFVDPRSDPQVFYRVFRLVPCIRYREKMALYMKCLVRSAPRTPLEIPAVPFYCIGGAGTHYPVLEEDGQPVYPENMRLPRRILGSTAHLDVAPVRQEEQDEGRGSDDRERLLKTLGFDGMWLDCHDVQGYLEEKGLAFREDSCVSVEGSEVPEETREPEVSAPTPKGKTRWVLNVEDFFQSLLTNMCILGRAPGFRLCDVEAAFKSTAKISSQ